MNIPTVRVKHPGGGFYVINLADFDPKTHERWEEEKPKAKARTKKPATGKPARKTTRKTAAKK